MDKASEQIAKERPDMIVTRSDAPQIEELARAYFERFPPDVKA